MPNTAEADKRLVAWLKERTDKQLERIMEAPDDGLTNEVYVRQDGCKCLAGWAFGAEGFSFGRAADHGDEPTVILEKYGLPALRPITDDGTVFRRIKAYVAAELLTRRVNRKRLPARDGPQASADGCGEIYALEAE